MNGFTKGLFATVSAIHALPLLALVGQDGLQRASGVSVNSAELVVLLSQRAIMFGILALMSGLAIFYQQFALPALLCLSISSASFLVIFTAQAASHILGAELWRVLWFDLLAVLLLATIWWQRRRAHGGLRSPL